MKYEIASHEIMRIDEYADEEGKAKAKAKDNANPNESVAKDREVAATDTAETPMSESPSSIDIPPETVINYDEPPAIAQENPLDAEMNDNEAPIETEDTSAAPIESVENYETEIDREAATKSADVAIVESAIDPGESLTDPEDMPTTEDAIEAVKSTTDSAHKTMMEAVETIESTTDAAKENMMDTVEAVKSTADTAKENVVDAVESTTDSAKETLETIQTKAPGVFNELTSAVPAFFQQNRQLLTNIGLIFLAFVVVKLAFAGINAIDDLPLVTPLLKIVGLVYVVKFIWNYLIREQDREKLVEKLNKTKAEVLGNRE
jgi:CAAD domains of cyanobacterial aminoacyl-tRNA synthetase